MREFNRRVLLARAASLAASSMALSACSGGVFGKTRGAYPFSLGVASGDPVQDGAVIWTRLLPYPQEPDRTGSDPIALNWRIAADAGMRKPVQAGSVIAHPEDAFATRVELRGLEPGRPYWYQFSTGVEESPVGQFVTAPPLGQKIDRFRIALASCSHYEQGFYAAYREMAEDAPDVILHVGDYIYESSWGDPVRRHEGAEPMTIDEYRARYALYRTDPDLQAAHARAPWLYTWDDHEVDNDYAADQAEDGMDPALFVQRRAAAYRACFDHMPLRRSQMLRGLEMRLFQRNVFGDLVDLNILDNRQYRSDNACQTPDRMGGQVVPLTCKDLLDESRTMLGKAQERQYFNNLKHTRGLWNVMANGVMFGRLKQKTRDGEPAAWTDAWDGYMAARGRIIQRVQDLKRENFVTLAGDMHSSWVSELKADFDKPESATVGTEFVCTSVTSAGPDYDLFTAMLPDNPHIKHFESRQRGYTRLTFTREALQAEMRVVDDVRNAKATLTTLASYIVENGKPGAIKA